MRADASDLKDLFETASLGAPEKAVGFVMWRVLHHYVREIDRALGTLDLTHLQFTTLAMAAWLGQRSEPTTQAQLARSADIHPMQVSHMLKALEGKGLVARPRGTSDVRTKHIELTPAGVAALRRAMPVVIGVQRRVFGEAGRPGGDLLSTLVRIDEALRSGQERTEVPSQ